MLIFTSENTIVWKTSMLLMGVIFEVFNFVKQAPSEVILTWIFMDTNLFKIN